VTYTLQVQQRCSTTQTNSTWGSIGSASYTRPVTLLNGTVNYGLSFSSSSGSYSVNIPGLVSITSVTTNNGGVSAYNSGTTAVFNVYSGSATTGSTTSTSNVSKVVNSTVGPQSSSYLPPTKSYNDGVYSGTLNRTNISSSLVSSSSKVVTYVNYSQGSLYHYEGQYYNYNVNGYVGSIPYVGFSGSGLDGAGNPIQYATYRGTVYKNVYNYTGTYSGTVYGQITTTNYYHYYYYYLTVNYKYR
ncbi:MAG: hypothetical protein PWQ10_96, partial [Patescibacteria group bacterium]|nr:hypothetical protein [Patescibacteria group bacterium]